MFVYNKNTFRVAVTKSRIGEKEKRRQRPKTGALAKVKAQLVINVTDMNSYVDRKTRFKQENCLKHKKKCHNVDSYNLHFMVD